MPQVYQPKPKADSTGKLLTVGGAVAGAAFGGLPGAATGASLGQMAGGLAAKPQGGATQVPTEQSAMSRKFNTVQDDPLLKLQESQSALAHLPPDLQKQYAPAIQQATLLEQQKRGMA